MIRTIFLLLFCVSMYAQDINEPKDIHDIFWIVPDYSERRSNGHSQTPYSAFSNYQLEPTTISTDVATASAILFLNSPVFFDAYKAEEKKRIENLPKEFKPLNITNTQ